MLCTGGDTGVDGNHGRLQSAESGGAESDDGPGRLVFRLRSATYCRGNRHENHHKQLGQDTKSRSHDGSAVALVVVL